MWQSPKCILIIISQTVFINASFPTVDALFGKPAPPPLQATDHNKRKDDPTATYPGSSKSEV